MKGLCVVTACEHEGATGPTGSPVMKAEEKTEAAPTGWIKLRCVHCSSPENGACLGDGLCHNGRRRGPDGLWPRDQWWSDESCREAYRRKTGERRDIVPCCLCSGHGHLLVSDGGRLSGGQWGTPGCRQPR